MSETLARYRVTGRLANGGNAQVDVWEPTIEKMRQDIDNGVYGDGAIRDLAEAACVEGETYLAEGRFLDQLLTDIELLQAILIEATDERMRAVEEGQRAIAGGHAILNPSIEERMRQIEKSQALLNPLLKLVQEYQGRGEATHTRLVEALAQFDAARQAEELEG